MDTDSELCMAQRTILIVDEVPEHRIILRHFLRASGYTVVEAAPGLAALYAARAVQPDLILAGLPLPGHPGWETARWLRAQPALAHVPILGTTVYTTLLTLPRVRAIGCTDFVAKPFNIDELLHRSTGIYLNRIAGSGSYSLILEREFKLQTERFSALKRQLAQPATDATPLLVAALAVFATDNVGQRIAAPDAMQKAQCIAHITLARGVSAYKHAKRAKR